jgi:outer membrane protein
MKKYIIYLVLLFSTIANAQQQLTLQNAIDTALKNNFDIQIAKNNAEIGKIENNFGYAGGLPVIDASASDNAYWHNTNQELSDGTKTSQTNAKGNTIDAGISASMYLFNGLKIIATKEKLEYLEQLSKIQLNGQIQSTIADIMMSYYDIVRQQSYLKIIQSTLDFSSKKLEIVNARNSVGMANAADLLQAQMDVNNATQNLKLQQMVVDKGKTDLYELMGAKQYTDFIVNDSISLDNSLVLDSVTTYLDRNTEYLSAEQQIKISEQIVKEISSKQYPSVRVSAGYDYVHSNFNSGTIRMNQYIGPSAGITLQVPLFSGNIYRTQRKSAQFDLENANLRKESLLNSLKANAIKTYISYSTGLTRIESQQVNYELSKKLAAVVLLNFESNQATILDMKVAQQTFEDAAYLLINMQYASKVAEIQLKELTYSLGY